MQAGDQRISDSIKSVCVVQLDYHIFVYQVAYKRPQQYARNNEPKDLQTLPHTSKYSLQHLPQALSAGDINDGHEALADAEREKEQAEEGL
jgi:hypothetical protein